MILFNLITFIQFGLSLSIGPPSGNPIYSCPLQKDCIKISIRPVHRPGDPSVRNAVVDQEGDQCKNYRVCFRLNFGGSCVRHPRADIGHACLNTNEEILFDKYSDSTESSSSSEDSTGESESSSEDDETGGIGHGYVECQIVEGGSNAVFSVYDGGGCEGSDEVSMMTDSDNNIEATCEPRPEDITTCASDVVTGSDCMWTVQVPSCSDDPTPFPTTFPTPSPTANTSMPTSSSIPTSLNATAPPSGEPPTMGHNGTYFNNNNDSPSACEVLPILCDPAMSGIMQMLVMSVTILVTLMFARMWR